jgi:aryl-phospho-beta-D-glucosidase BglC (GH1 family)
LQPPYAAQPPTSTIIATGERWGGIDGLRELKPLSDRNVVYSFHWYEPFTFTYQGATWAGPVQAELSGIPHPSSPDSVEGIVAGITDPRARTQVQRYGGEAWNESRIRAGLARAVDWASSNGVPVFCGEFGVYLKVALQADRLKWIQDVRSSLESLGIGWSMWDYETDFGPSPTPSQAGGEGSRWTRGAYPPLVSMQPKCPLQYLGKPRQQTSVDA